MKYANRKCAIGAALVFLLSTVALGTASAADDEATYKMAYEDAVAALDMAASVDGEWRDARWPRSKAVKVKVDGETKSMSYLAAAEAYAKMGDWKNAIKYAEIARFQGVAGYQQAMGQKDAKPLF
jgi:hypothetical protein